MSTSKVLTYKVNEIFYSIQGESTQAGRPCVFLRLSGCPLRCHYCDTEYAFYEGQKMSIDEILTQVKGYDCPLVELTGGEPMAHPNAPELLEKLVESGFQVMLETSGAFSLEKVPSSVKIVMDVKTPDSGESKKMLWDNFKFLKDQIDEIKFVVCSRADFDYAVKVATDYHFFDRFPVLLSPSFEQVKLEDLANWVLNSKLNFRMQTQMHKYIWDPQMRGV